VDFDNVQHIVESVAKYKLTKHVTQMRSLPKKINLSKNRGEKRRNGLLGRRRWAILRFGKRIVWSARGQKKRNDLRFFSYGRMYYGSGFGGAFVEIVKIELNTYFGSLRFSF